MTHRTLTQLLCASPLLALCASAAMVAQSAAGRNAVPETLASVRGNNTSAADTYPGTFNGMPKGGNVSPLSITSMLATGDKTRYISHFMPNFSTGCGLTAEKCLHHVTVGYESDSKEQMAKQLADMLQRGFSVVWLDWFGPDNKHHDSVAMRMMQESERLQRGGAKFNFVIQPDHGSLNGCDAEACFTAKLIQVLTYDYNTYEKSPAYLRWEGRPVVPFFWNNKTPVDWAKVKAGVPGNPLFLFLHTNAFKQPEADGAFAWNGNTGPTDVGLQYLDHFYDVGAEHKDKIIVGSAYAGFDDRLASWGKNKIIPQRCGMTWLDTMQETLRYEAKSGEPLPFVQIVTWNDYEEGTSVEPGISNCVVAIPVSIGDGKLSWSVAFGKDTQGGATGSESTIAYFRILKQVGKDKVLEVKRVPAVLAHSVYLAPLKISQGDRLYVQAVGQSMIQNHLSDAIQVP